MVRFHTNLEEAVTSDSEPLITIRRSDHTMIGNYQHRAHHVAQPTMTPAITHVEFE